MKILSTLSILFFFSIISVAQQPGKIVNTVKGKVINSSTNEPVSYTNIGLEGTYYGTASDGDGNFELKIPHELLTKNIFFSAVGFKNKKFPVKSLFNKEFNVIKIENQSYGIDNIDIAAQNRVLIRILRMASENIPHNFIRGPYNLYGDYRNEKTSRDTIINQNIEVIIYDDKGYVNPSKEDAFRSLKYSLKKEKSEKDIRFSTGATNLDEILELDWARSATSVLNPALTGGFQLKLESEPNIDGKNFWVISFKQKQPTLVGSGDFYATSFEGKITIDKEDYSVFKIEGKVESQKNNRQGKVLAIGKSNTHYFTNVNYDFSIRYSNLKPDIIELNKSYLFDGEEIQEHSSLKITRVKTTDLTLLNSRQYYTGG